ncbi:MAG TPA: DsrE family protein [Bacteroidales bacterium]|nr:DsrE family protein [Bacteroidales bacterium]HRZ48539.1 DsrE family protein [Bacteroidales bacterium]
MKIGVIIETKEFEKAWNAFRFAITAKKQGHDVKVFLMGEAVENAGQTVVICFFSNHR